MLTDAIVSLFVIAALSGSLLTAFHLAETRSAHAERSAMAVLLARQCLTQVSTDAGHGTKEAGGELFAIERVRGRDEAAETDKVRIVRTACSVSWKGNRAERREVRLERIDVEPTR